MYRFFIYIYIKDMSEALVYISTLIKNPLELETQIAYTLLRDHMKLLIDKNFL